MWVTRGRDDVYAMQARRRLAEDRPEGALAALGSGCDASVPPPRLIELGEVHEFEGSLPQAQECYRLAAGDRVALLRLARVAERAPDARLALELQRAAAAEIPEALWALARLDLAAGRQDQALPRIDRFLLRAAPVAPGLAAARAPRERILRSSTAAAPSHLRGRASAGRAILALLVSLSPRKC